MGTDSYTWPKALNLLTGIDDRKTARGLLQDKFGDQIQASTRSEILAEKLVCTRLRSSTQSFRSSAGLTMRP